jgi:hypothetical protein
MRGHLLAESLENDYELSGIERHGKNYWTF